MMPVRECLRATHWKRVQFGPREFLTPCSPDEPGAIRKVTSHWTHAGNDKKMNITLLVLP